MPKTRIAVAGAGYIGQAHLQAVLHSSTCELLAVVDPSPKAADVCAKAGVPLYPSLDDLLARQRPDGIVLATPNALHLQQALQCMSAGLPILLEKPLAINVVEGEELVRAAERLGARVLIGHHRAHSPIMSRSIEVVQSGRLGRLVAVMGSAAFFKPDQYFSDNPWRKQAGGGPVLLNMIHEVHNLRMLCGEISAVQAFASQAVRGFEVEDTVAISLRFVNGALGTFMLSDTAACARSWEQTTQENKAYASYGDEDCYVITGTHGCLSVPTMRLKTYAQEQDRSWWNPFELGFVALERDDPIRLQMEHFGAVIRGESEPRVTARDGLNNLKVTETILQAAKSGQTVYLDSL